MPPADGSNLLYSVRYNEALAWMSDLHRGQTQRKFEYESPVPVIAHLLEVSSRIWIAGGGEDEAIAGLLHDSLEDAYYPGIESDIEDRFGPRVLELVKGCSYGRPGENTGPLSWEEGKVEYLDRLRKADLATLRVAWAEKISNVRAVVEDLEAGRPLFELFQSPRQETLEYFGQLGEVFKSRWGNVPEVRRYLALVERMGSPMLNPNVWSVFGNAHLALGEPYNFQIIPAAQGTVSGLFPFETDAYILTAWNPMMSTLPDSVNGLRNQALREQLRADGINVVDCAGFDPQGAWREEGFLVTGLESEHTALELGRHHGQAAIYRWSPQALTVLECFGRRQSDSGWSISTGS